MRKIYFLFTFLITALTVGQSSDLYFSMYGEGSSNNKWLEIYNGTGADVDLVNYSVQLYPNGAAEANNTLTFEVGTTISNGDVYVIYNSSANASIIANGDIAATVTFFNGDDAVALLKAGTVIDVIGEIGNDPGSAWAVGSTANGTANHTLVRKAEVCDPNPTNLGSFGTDDDTSEWIVYDSDAEWGQIGTHTGCSSTTSINITSPANAAVIAPGTTSVDVVFSTSNTTGTETVDITVNGTTVNNITSPYSITTTNGTTYDVTVELIDGSVIDSDMVSFSVATSTQVANLAALRADYIANGPGATYELLSTPTVTYTRSSRNQKYIQDATGGILIDDSPGVITTSFSIGDGITGLVGTASEFNGLLQFVPATNASVATGATVTPTVVTIATLLTDWENYESQLVRINAATFADAGSTFAASTDYNLSDGATINFRTNFSEADYIDQTIPTGANPIVVLVGGFMGTPQVTSRSTSDVTLSILSNEISSFKVYPNPTTELMGHWIVFEYHTYLDEGDITAVVYGIDGREAMRWSDKIYQSGFQFQGFTMENLPNGMYLVRLVTQDRDKVYRIIKK